jgi:beta-galactosidase
MREKILWNDSWLFCLDDQENMSQTDYDDKNWTRVGLPHDWSILCPFLKQLPSGAGGGYCPSAETGGIGNILI